MQLLCPSESGFQGIEAFLLTDVSMLCIIMFAPHTLPLNPSADACASRARVARLGSWGPPFS